MRAFFTFTTTTALLLTGALLVACGDDTSTGTGGGGGEAPTSTTSSTTTTASSTSSSSSSSTGGDGGSGGQGTGGNGTGGGGTGGQGTGGAEPAECTLADLVADEFFYETQLVADDGHYECLVEGLDASSPTIETTLSCIQGDIAFLVTLSYTPEPALEGPFPLAPGLAVTFDDLSEDSEFPPVSEGYVVRSQATGKLLFSWVAGAELGPPLADADWAAPLSITDVQGICSPDQDAYEHRALDVVLGDDPAVRIFSDQIVVLEQPQEPFEIRVSDATYNDEIDGGFNRLFRYAILSPELSDVTN